MLVKAVFGRRVGPGFHGVCIGPESALNAILTVGQEVGRQGHGRHRREGAPHQQNPNQEGVGQRRATPDLRQFLALHRGEDGGLYVGTADDAVLYRIDPAGGGRAIHDFAGNEVRAIVQHGGSLYVAVNDMQRGDAAAKATPTKITPAPAGSVPGVKAPAPPGSPSSATVPRPHMTIAAGTSLIAISADGARSAGSFNNGADATPRANHDDQQSPAGIHYQEGATSAGEGNAATDSAARGGALASAALPV